MNDQKNLPAPPPPPKTASSQATPQQKPNNTAPKPPIKTDKVLLATPQQDATRLSPTRVASPAPSVTSISTHGSEDSSGAGSPIRPVSPRTIEISHAVAPVAMQAITQNNDYLSTTSHTTKPLPRSSSSSSGNDQKPLAPAPLRSSSFRQQGPPSPSMRSQPQPNPAAKKALPQGPVASYATPPPSGYYAPRPHQPIQHVPPPMGRPVSANMPSSRSPSPGLPPTPGYTNDPSRPPPPPPGHHLHTPPHLRPQRSMDELNSPPRSVSFIFILYMK